MMRTRVFYGTLMGTAVIAFLSMTVFAPEALGQIPGEIPLTHSVPVGARAMGMAGAYSAVADDATALFYNPAALARVERIELALSIGYNRVEDETQHLGNVPMARDASSTRVNHLGFAYPFPTYRGSLVIGMAFNQLANLDRDYLRMGHRGTILEDEERIIEDGSLNAWTGGIAFDASPRVSLGLSASLLTGTSYRESESHYLEDGVLYGGRPGMVSFDTNIIEDTDIVGVTGAFGALVRVGESGRFSLVLNLPKAIDLDGDAFDDILEIFKGDDGAEPDTLTDVYEDSVFESNLTLPFSTTVGLAWRFGDILAAGDLQLTDWTAIDFEGPLRTPDREEVYRTTLGVRVGGEFAPSEWPVRLRAGFAYDPVPYKIVITNIYRDEYEEAEFSPDRFELSLGAGALLEESFTVDAAYAHSWFEREAPGSSGAPLLTEGRTEDKFYLGAAFRF